MFFSTVDVLPTGTSEPIDFLAPSVLALAVMSTAMVSLGIGTGFERYYGVLKRLGGSPLGRGRWVSAKIATVLVTEVVQWVVLIAVSLLLGWSPPGAGGRPPWSAALLGTAAFAGLGPPDGRDAARPGDAGRRQRWLYLVLLLTGGMVVPLDELPDRARGRGEGAPGRAAGRDPDRLADRRPLGRGVGVGVARRLGGRRAARRRRCCSAGSDAAG